MACSWDGHPSKVSYHYNGLLLVTNSLAMKSKPPSESLSSLSNYWWWGNDLIEHRCTHYVAEHDKHDNMKLQLVSGFGLQQLQYDAHSCALCWSRMNSNCMCVLCVEDLKVCRWDDVRPMLLYPNHAETVWWSWATKVQPSCLITNKKKLSPHIVVVPHYPLAICL